MAENLTNEVNLTNTDPKPHSYYFNGDSNLLVNTFFTKVKPIEGVVKYKMVSWENFPKTIDEAKKLSLTWVNLFNNNSLYQGLKVVIYFHLDKKTIRFELKKNDTQVVNLDKESNVLDVVKTFSYQINTVLFNCEQTNFFDSLKLDDCKELGKTISLQLENIHLDKKFIVFVNPNNKSIKITIKC